MYCFVAAALLMPIRKKTNECDLLMSVDSRKYPVSERQTLHAFQSIFGTRLSGEKNGRITPKPGKHMFHY